jgi:hypothetical protein
MAVIELKQQTEGTTAFRSRCRAREKAEAQEGFAAALKRGFQTRSVELDLARFLGDLSDGLNFSLPSQ